MIKLTGKINKFWKFLIIFTFIFICSCQINSYTSISEDLANESLMGEWKLTEDSISTLKRENLWDQNLELKLILKENNSFELKNIPNCWTNTIQGCSKSGLYYSGKWSINKDEDSSKWLHLDDVSSNTVHAIPIVKRNGRILILFTLGDPDGPNKIFLEKS